MQERWCMVMLKKIKSMLKTSKKDKPEQLHYYKLPRKCQIPRLECLYTKYFGEIDDGAFVEVGAFDGESVSNTCYLADLGWKGFYIEPVPEYFEKCVIRHQSNKKIKVHNIAIGPSDGKVRINIAGYLSTIDVETRNTFKNLAWAKDKITDEYVEAVQTTLDRYLSENDIDKEFELLVVDVEGYEWDVLKAFDVKLWSPKMVIIELHDQNPDYPHLMEKCGNIVKYFEKANYRVVYKDFTNTVYVNKKFIVNK